MQVFGYFLWREQFQGLKAEKRLAFFSLADSRWAPHNPSQILAKLSTPRASLSNSKKTARGIYFTNCYTLGQTRDSPAGMFLVFSRYSRQFSRPCSHTSAGQTTAVDPIVNSTGAKKGVCRWKTISGLLIFVLIIFMLIICEFHWCRWCVLVNNYF